MVSDFRKKKLLRGFEFFDTDKSGSIEKADFELAVDRIKKIRGLQDGDPKIQKTHDFMMKVWDGIQKQADSDNDGSVTSDEWLNLWDEYSKNPQPLEWQELLAKAIFAVLDAGNDGTIDKDEFIKVTTSFGRKPEEATTAFEKISKGKSSLSFEDFKVLWKEYFAADDPNAPGNFIFGRTAW